MDEDNVDDTPTGPNHSTIVDNEDPMLSEEETMYAATIGRYDQLINACKTLRARLLFTQAGLQEGSLQDGDEDVDDGNSDRMSSVEKVGEDIHLMSIQEEALKLAKVSRLFANVHMEDDKDIATLLKQHAAFQSTIAEKAEEIRASKQREIECKRKLLEGLSEYIASLEVDRVKLLDVSISKDPSNEKTMKKCNDYVYDIRFMQVCISELVSALRLNLQSDPKLKEIIQELRDPVTSVDQFF